MSCRMWVVGLCAVAAVAACDSASSPAGAGDTRVPADTGGALDTIGPVDAGTGGDTAVALDAAVGADTPPAGRDTAAVDGVAPTTCETDRDCPGCEVCDLPEVGPRTCVDPTAGSGVRCETRLDCPQQSCCSYSPFDAKPECGGLCVYDGGAADCSGCAGQGMQISGGSERCCPGLTPIPANQSYGGSGCFPSRCFCMVCVRGCGDGLCTNGEDPCNCARDCPTRFDGGPGAACTADADCTSAGAGCLPEASGYPIGGYCTGGVCDPGSQTDLCPAGTVCTGTTFSQAYLCLPTCRRDADCRQGLSCEAFSELAPSNGGYFCWQSSRNREHPQLGNGLGEPCAQDDDCISHLCLAHPSSGANVCAAFCNDQTPCKEGQTCAPMGGCAGPGCGACF